MLTVPTAASYSLRPLQEKKSKAEERECDSFPMIVHGNENYTACTLHRTCRCNIIDILQVPRASHLCHFRNTNIKVFLSWERWQAGALPGVKTALSEGWQEKSGVFYVSTKIS